MKDDHTNVIEFWTEPLDRPVSGGGNCRCSIWDQGVDLIPIFRAQAARIATIQLKVAETSRGASIKNMPEAVACHVLCWHLKISKM